MGAAGGDGRGEAEHPHGIEHDDVFPASFHSDGRHTGANNTRKMKTQQNVGATRLLGLPIIFSPIKFFWKTAPPARAAAQIILCP